jgi:type IV pilus assembly protein PilM
MANPTGVWGIDLGQCGLKALRLEEIDGQLTATAFDYVEHPKILSQPDADPDQLTREALEKFLSRNNLRGDQVCISVPGQSGLARFVKLPPVEEKKITDIVRFEAKQQIPFNLDEVVWDYQKIGSGMVTDGFALETEIGLFAMKRDMVNRYLQHFKDVNVEVHVVQMAPLALCNFVAYDLLGKGPNDAPEGETKCAVALDIGADSSNLVITDANRVIWQRPIPIGGNHFTRALTKDLKLTFAKAEHLKRNATKSPDLKKILAALKPVLNDFVGEVQRSLGYFTNTHRDAQISYLMGLGNAFRLPGMQRFLGEKLQLDVRKLGKMERLVGDSVVTAPVFTENILSFGVAYGLALQGINQGRITTNLLPGELRVERLIRAKKPWAAAAAAALLLGTGALGLSYWLEHRTYGAESVLTAMKESGEIVKKASAAQAAFTKTKEDAIKEEEAVKAIVAGQQERTNWLELNHFIAECIPQPDGSNLPGGDIRKLYWATKPNAQRPRGVPLLTGQEAFGEFVKRIAGGSAPVDKDATEAPDPLGRGIDDLIQFNIEAIDCRFADDLPGFWRAVRTKVTDDGYIRPLDQAQKPPEGKGWVVEVRGYTFHYLKERFVIETLLQNIARFGIQTPEPAPGPDGKPAAPADTSKPATPTDPAKSGDLPNKGPVINRVSHVVLYNFLTKPTSDTGSFEIIGSTSVADLARGSGMGGPGEMGAGGMGGMMMPKGGPPTGDAREGGGPATPTSVNRDGWASLLGGGGAVGMMGGMRGGSGMAPGMTGGDSRRGGGGMAAMVRPLGPTPGGPSSMGGFPRPGGIRAEGMGAADSSTGSHSRTEFVVLFVWKEPTPSDALRGITDEAPK